MFLSLKIAAYNIHKANYERCKLIIGCHNAQRQNVKSNNTPVITMQVHKIKSHLESNYAAA